VIKQDEMILEDSWIDELYKWADSNNIPDLQYIEENLDDKEERMFNGFWVGLPRDRDALKSLEELDLSWHSCLKIPEQIRHLKMLKKFSFSKSPDGLTPHFYKNADGLDALEEIPDWIAELENLEELNLSGNHIKYVPKAIGKLKNLKKLYLHSNKIMFVEDEIEALSNLEVLWIQWNKLSLITDYIKNLTEIIKLKVDWGQPNKLSVLSECLKQIQKDDLDDKQYFYMKMNDLTTLHNGLSTLKALTKSDDLDILWNEWDKLSSIKNSIRKLENLGELYCDGLERSKYGPIKLCPEGLIVSVEEEPTPEDESAVLLEDTPVFLLTNDDFEMVIELTDHHGKSLAEKIDFVGLWK
jgi:Leucine-rich repeat (LRR) protein